MDFDYHFKALQTCFADLKSNCEAEKRAIMAQAAILDDVLYTNKDLKNPKSVYGSADSRIAEFETKNKRSKSYYSNEQEWKISIAEAEKELDKLKAEMLVDFEYNQKLAIHNNKVVEGVIGLIKRLGFASTKHDYINRNKTKKGTVNLNWPEELRAGARLSFNSSVDIDRLVTGTLNSVKKHHEQKEALEKAQAATEASLKDIRIGQALLVRLAVKYHLDPVSTTQHTLLEILESGETPDIEKDFEELEKRFFPKEY